MHVAFDIGNVLCKVNLKVFEDELDGFIHSTPYHFLEEIQGVHEIGSISMRHAIRSRLSGVFSRLNPSLLDKLIDHWNGAVTPNDMMLKFLDNLRSEGVNIALLSNIGYEHATYLRNICPDMFKAKEHLSFEVGARKPTNIYFQSFLTDNPEFAGAVYIDDREENLKAGKKYSFKSYKFCLDEVLTLSQSAQKKELDKIRSFIINRYDASVGT